MTRASVADGMGSVSLMSSIVKPGGGHLEYSSTVDLVLLADALNFLQRCVGIELLCRRIILLLLEVQGSGNKEWYCSK